MQNDMLKNNVAPWQEKGRWYHATVISDGTNFTLDTNKSDPYFNDWAISGSVLYTSDFSKGYAVDMKVILHDAPATSNFINWGINAFYIRTNNSGMAIYLIVGASYYIGPMDVYVFVCHDNN